MVMMAMVMMMTMTLIILVNNIIRGNKDECL